MRGKIQQRFEPVEKAYRSFLERNPKHVKAHIAFGSFLGDIGREDEASVEYIKARELDPKNCRVYTSRAVALQRMGAPDAEILAGSDMIRVLSLCVNNEVTRWFVLLEVG